MNKVFFLIVLALFCNTLLAQDYMDKVAQDACECLDKISDTANAQAYKMELGVCMLEAASPYEKKLKKDYDIDFSKIDTEGEALGRIIGLKMASVCPNQLMAIANKVSQQKESEEGEIEKENFISGQITDVSGDKFIVFSVKDDDGKVSKYYWFSFVESNVEMSTQYKQLKNSIVEITYRTEDFFDARIAEYRPINIIQSLEVSE